MRIKADEMIGVLRRQIQDYDAKLAVEEVGTIVEVGDGIARVYGLTNVMAGEMIEFPNGSYGLALNLEEDNVGVAIMGRYDDLREGDVAKRTARVLEVPAGPALIGRVVDPVGRPLDGKGPVLTDKRRPVESPAPGVAGRQPVKRPLQTGVKAVDAMIPIGRGQRELIIGDRKTGKTAIAIDAIINQKDVICVYVAIGQKESTVAGVVKTLEAHHALDHTIVVTAGASDPAPLQYLAPYAGCAMAEYFMYEEGKDTLCVYDDLSKHAAAYREMSLLLRRPPGREAYPGDVFYLHSRLLERSAKLAERHVIVPVAKADPVTDKDAVNGKVYMGETGAHSAAAELKGMPNAGGFRSARVAGSGGSLTAFPVIETQEGEVSAYIPTNVISITDGQIYLVPDLFNAGVRPAVDVGISVSRVGGNAQIKAMKKVAGTLRLDLASFRELEAFAQLGTELDPVTQKQLDRGHRIVELLKQQQYGPIDVVDQVIAIYAATKGLMDDIPVNEIRAFERAVVTEIRDAHKEIVEAIRKSGALTDETAGLLDKAIAEFKARHGQATDWGRTHDEGSAHRRRGA
ncbi:MAG TPA: F0F1 ATP synthase subunit alpha [Planctomycetota bacterium]|nr:F0F1 ATP synthase subunit alpha [Planctomycetota bacterium]